MRNKIGDKIEEECASNSQCVITISSVTDFQWSKLYVFSPTATLEDVNSRLGFEYPYYKEFSRIMVFVNHGKIVYHEEEPASIERLRNKDVIFNYSDSVKSSSYTPTEKFKASVNSIDDGIYYELTPLN